MKAIFTTFLLAFGLVSVQAQCPTGTVTLTTQAEVDAFGTDWPNCTDFPDTLIIGEYWSGSDITNLLGLQNLSSVGGNLSINSNDALISLAGLESLSLVSGNLSIWNNNALTSLAALESLSSVGGYLSFQYNDALTSLVGLENLNSVGGHLGISNNDALTSLMGLESLSSVGGGLSVHSNRVLIGFRGLEGLSSMIGGFFIGNNDALASLEGLGNISGVSGNIHIFSNPILSVCSIWSICQYLQGYDPSVQYASIHDNASGCNSKEEIELSCLDAFNYMSGQIYADLDCNSTFDGADAYSPNVFITKANGTPIAATNGGGEYVALLALGTINTLRVNAPSGYTAQPNTFQILTNDTLTAYTGYDFRLCPDSLFKDASVHVAAINPPRPGFNNTYHICYENIGTQPTDVTLALTFSDEAAAYLSIEDADGGMVIDNSIVWSLTDVPVFGQACFTVVVSLLPATPLGSLLIANASISVVSDDVADTFKNTQTVVGSYDPNDKSVSPTENDVETAEGPQRLTYTVRFQNTSTFPAEFVEVLDTLEANLDIKTLQLLSASHAYRLTVLDDHILKFRFDSINLPDSTSDEASSYGYVMFSLETVNGLQLGNVVNNSAAIYFDFNAPFLTDTATSTFVTSSLNDANVLPLQVSPNPAHRTTTVFVGGNDSSKVQLINTLGNVMQQHEVSGSSALTLDVSALPSGVYFIRVTRGTGMGVAKLVKE